MDGGGSQESQVGVVTPVAGESAGQGGQLKTPESSGQPQATEPPKGQTTPGDAQKSEPAAKSTPGTAKPDSAASQDSKPATSAETQPTAEIRTLQDYLGLNEIQLGILKDQGFDLQKSSWDILSDKEQAKRVLAAISSLGLEEEQRKKVEEIQRIIEGANPSLEYIAQKKAELRSIIENPNSTQEQIKSAEDQLGALEEMERQMSQLKNQKKNFLTKVSEQAPRYIKLFGIGGFILLLMGLIKGFEEFKGTHQGR